VAAVAEVRIRVPASIKKDDVVTVRALVPHPMEIIQRDASNKVVEKVYNFISSFTVTYNGREVMTGQLTQAISANPVFSFPLKATEPGKLVITFVDETGEKHQGSVDIKF
jgi:sulfur-oxidizing protein SoxZ